MNKVFVVGCPRSGTTWTRSILRAHPLVIGPVDETHLYDELYRPIVEGGLAPEARKRIIERYDARPLGEDLGLHLLVPRDELSALLEQAEVSGRARAEAADDVIAGVLDGFVTRAGAAEDCVFVEKTPSHILHAERILRRFPEARIVEVLRDGRDVCVSMQHRATAAAWVPRSRDEQIRVWVEAVRIGMMLRSSPDTGPRWHVFRFEAARRDPGRAIADLYAFCGLPFDDALVERVVADTDFSRNIDTGPGKVFRRGAIGDWRADFDAADIALFTRLAGDTLEAAGYSL